MNVPTLAQLTPDATDRVLSILALELKLQQTISDARDWRKVARPDQVMPDGDWHTWLILAGRGWGKTRTGSEAIHELVRRRLARRIALVGKTIADVRDVMIEGPLSGLLATARRGERPQLSLTPKLRLRWPNGAVATGFSAEDPDSLRGPQFDTAWLDELAAWRYPEAYDQLQFGLRLGHARQIVTTTPRPTRVVRELRDEDTTAVTFGRTMDNAANLAPAQLAFLQLRYGGTRLGRQELDGELLEDVEGAAWKRAWIDDYRWKAGDALPLFLRIVVGLDPSESDNERADDTGIVAVASAAHEPDKCSPRVHDHFYVLEDATGHLSPAEWGAEAVRLLKARGADLIVGETNRGGQMVERVIRSVDVSVPFKSVRATRGKLTRAEPVTAMYEQGRVHHVGMFAALEDQMVSYVPDGKMRSPDRMDALVWALTELGVRDEPGILGAWREELEQKERAAADVAAAA